ncbi:MAG: oligoendopeptidase F [Chloroflexota bacterium]
MFLKKFAPLAVCALLSINGALMNANAQGSLPTRDKIEDRYKWNLKDLYPSDAAWEADYKYIESQLGKFAGYKGKLGKSAKDLLDFLNFYYGLDSRFAKLYMYSSLSRDADLNNGAYAIMSDRVTKLGSEYGQAASFVQPELNGIDKSKMEGFIKQEKGLQAYGHILLEVYRMKPHTLSEDQEKIFAALGPSLAVPRETYDVLNDAELPFPTVKDPEGNDVQISHGRYRAALFSQDRAYRERVYKGNYVPYMALKNTIATLYNGRLSTRIAAAKLRNYKSAREMAVFGDNITKEIYDNLLAMTNKNLKTQHRWASIKKRVLKLDEFHPYDTYVSLFPGVDKKYTFDEAKEIVIKALAPLGEEYGKALRKAFDNRWIDVYETVGKRSGAYSNGCGCGVHPWVLLNWNGTLDDMFTLAHEMGHNMHSYFTEANQPYHYANYSTFVAEIASTTNEALLLDYLIENARTKDEKAALLEKFMTNAQQTFFRQTQFAEFEAETHARAEKGQIMGPDELTKLFGDQYKKYWGPEMVMDEEEGYSWERIPHLYNYDFYVFQYATGFSAAQAFSEMIKTQGQPAIDRYLGFLRSGSSDYGIDVLKKAGVDMTRPDPIQKTIDKMNKYLDELEGLLK